MDSDGSLRSRFNAGSMAVRTMSPTLSSKASRSLSTDFITVRSVTFISSSWVFSCRRAAVRSATVASSTSRCFTSQEISFKTARYPSDERLTSLSWVNTTRK